MTCGQFSPDGRAVVTGGGEGDCSLRVWDPKSGACLHSIQGTQFHSTGLPLGPSVMPVLMYVIALLHTSVMPDDVLAAGVLTLMKVH